MSKNAILAISQSASTHASLVKVNDSWAQHSTMFSILASRPCCPGFPGLIPSVPQKNSVKKIVNVAEVNQGRCLEEI